MDATAPAVVEAVEIEPPAVAAVVALGEVEPAAAADVVAALLEP